MDAFDVNVSVWNRLYDEGKNDLRYPSDVLVRLGSWIFGRPDHKRILDFGFGTGANLLHFAGLGFEMYGVEVSLEALKTTERRLKEASLRSELRLIGGGEPLPFSDNYFDVAYAWQVLYYADRSGWIRAVHELERVTRSGGQILIATAAPGDVSQLQAELLEPGVYRSTVEGQEGCIVTILEFEDIQQLLPNRDIRVGEFGYSFGGKTARHWIISYTVG